MNVIYYLLLQAQVNADKLPKLAVRSSLPGILRTVLAAAAILSVVFVAFGGIKYTLSGGDPQGLSKAKDTILYALVGLVVAISAFTIVSFVGSRL